MDSLALAAVVATVGLLGCSLGNATAAEQRISLQEGWNAVFLELEPNETSPDKVFSNQPIEQCALWLPSKAKVDSLTDPTAIPSKSTDWLVWHPANHSAAFLNNLRILQARRALLIKASAAATLIIQGDPVFERRSWVAPSFNLTGFDVDPTSPPTFARFFDGSQAHDELKVFKLIDGTWKRVSGHDVVQRGEAYWVWTKEGSDFQGPLDLSLVVGDVVRLEAIANGTLPITLAINTAGASSIPLHVGRRHRIEIGRSVDMAGSALNITGGGMQFQLPIPQDQ